MNNLRSFLTFTLCVVLTACASHQQMDFNYGEDSADLTDADRDGVINVRDICPDTQLGSKVLHDGCVIWEQVDNTNDAVIFFDMGTSEIRVEHLSDVKKILAYAAKHAESFIMIEGHTSIIGSKDVNDRLQNERSAKIREFLVQEGADPARIMMHTQGEKSQRLDHEIHGIAAHTVNQRVLIRVVRTEKSIQKKWNIYGE